MAWISGPFTSKSDWIKCGVMLQRMWLEMTKRDVYMCPMGPVITTPASQESFIERIGYKQQEGKLWFLVRMGYSKVPARSYRLETDDLLIS